MGNVLSIEDEEACRLAAELSALTGESVSTAITEALRQRGGAAEGDP